MADNSSSCEYAPMDYLEVKFLLVGVFGAGISLMGMGMNFIVAFVLGRLTYRCPSPLIYLFTLALWDFAFCFEYIIMLSAQIYFDYFESIRLFTVWNSYSPTAFTVSKIVQTAATYLIVVASVERFMDVGGFSGSAHICTTRSRLIVICAVMAFSVVFRIPSFWEIQLKEELNCTGFARYRLEPSEIGKEPIFKFYSFYAVNILQVFLPFALLILLNFGIIYRIRSGLKNEEKAVFHRQSAWQGSNKQESLRAATRMLACVVATYLLSNILSVTITIMEHSEKDFLLYHREFYTFSVDCISLLYVLTAATRLLIYIGCSEKIRSEVYSLFDCGDRENDRCCLSESRPLGIAHSDETPFICDSEV